jgi:hypothetical protein
MKQEVFPSNMIAGFFRFQPAEFFSVPKPSRRCRASISS